MTSAAQCCKHRARYLHYGVNFVLNLFPLHSYILVGVLKLRRTTCVLLRLLQECATSEQRAPFYLMLGMLHLADKKRVTALEMLHRLESCDSRLAPER